MEELYLPSNDGELSFVETDGNIVLDHGSQNFVQSVQDQNVVFAPQQLYVVQQTTNQPQVNQQCILPAQKAQVYRRNTNQDQRFLILQQGPVQQQETTTNFIIQPQAQVYGNFANQPIYSNESQIIQIPQGIPLTRKIVTANNQEHIIQGNTTSTISSVVQHPTSSVNQQMNIQVQSQSPIRARKQTYGRGSILKSSPVILQQQTTPTNSPIVNQDFAKPIDLMPPPSEQSPLQKKRSAAQQKRTMSQATNSTKLIQKGYPSPALPVMIYTEENGTFQATQSIQAGRKILTAHPQQHIKAINSNSSNSTTIIHRSSTSESHQMQDRTITSARGRKQSFGRGGILKPISTPQQRQLPTAAIASNQDQFLKQLEQKSSLSPNGKMEKTSVAAQQRRLISHQLSNSPKTTPKCYQTSLLPLTYDGASLHSTATVNADQTVTISINDSIGNETKNSGTLTVKQQNYLRQQMQQQQTKTKDEDLTLCNHCGILSEDLSLCSSCHRPINKGRQFTGILTTSAQKITTVQLPVSSASVAPSSITLNKQDFYSKTNVATAGRGLIEKKQHATRGRGRGRGRGRPVDEPVILTLSSDDDEEEESAVKTSSFDSDARVNKSVENPPSKSFEPINKKEPVITENMESTLQPSCGNYFGGGDTPAWQRDLKEMGPINPKNIIGPMTLLPCRSLRIGSYKCIPVDRILLFSQGIRLAVPSIEDESPPVVINIPVSAIIKMLCHFGSSFPVFFIYVMPSLAAYVRHLLKMIDRTGLFFDPCSEKECQRRITLLPQKMDDNCRCLLKELYSISMGEEDGGTAPLMEELQQSEANEILVNSSPSEDGLVVRKPASFVKYEATTLLIYPPPPNKGAISITSDDYRCLADEQFLNDVIIDFYLKWLLTSKLSEENRKRTHVFSTFFYKRLTSKPKKKTRPVGSAEDDPTLTPGEKRHARVKSWTKGVDIFDKDFIVIPINEHSHWFLAIICFPGLDGPVRICDSLPVAPPPIDASVEKKNKKQTKAKILNKIEIPVLDDGCGDWSDRDEAEGEEDELVEEEEDDDEDDDEEKLRRQTEKTDEAPPSKKAKQRLPEELDPLPPPEAERRPIPTRGAAKSDPLRAIKQPCIIIFDSLTGARRVRIVATLREYLTVEHRVKRGAKKVFTKDLMKGACPRVPQQMNFSDCGIFTLQFAEAFFQQPLADYSLPMRQLSDWFPQDVINCKRESIAALIKELMDNYKPNHGIQLPDITFNSHEFDGSGVAQHESDDSPTNGNLADNGALRNDSEELEEKQLGCINSIVTGEGPLNVSVGTENDFQRMQFSKPRVSVTNISRNELLRDICAPYGNSSSVTIANPLNQKSEGQKLQTPPPVNKNQRIIRDSETSEVLLILNPDKEPSPEPNMTTQTETVRFADQFPNSGIIRNLQVEPSKIPALATTTTKPKTTSVMATPKPSFTCIPTLKTVTTVIPNVRNKSAPVLSGTKPQPFSLATPVMRGCAPFAKPRTANPRATRPQINRVIPSTSVTINIPQKTSSVVCTQSTNQLHLSPEALVRFSSPSNVDCFKTTKAAAAAYPKGCGEIQGKFSPSIARHSLQQPISSSVQPASSISTFNKGITSPFFASSTSSTPTAATKPNLSTTNTPDCRSSVNAHVATKATSSIKLSATTSNAINCGSTTLPDLVRREPPSPIYTKPMDASSIVATTPTGPSLPKYLPLSRIGTPNFNQPSLSTSLAEKFSSPKPLPVSISNSTTGYIETALPKTVVLSPKNLTTAYLQTPSRPKNSLLPVTPISKEQGISNRLLTSLTNNTSISLNLASATSSTKCTYTPSVTSSPNTSSSSIQSVSDSEEVTIEGEKKSRSIISPSSRTSAINVESNISSKFGSVQKKLIELAAPTNESVLPSVFRFSEKGTSSGRTIAPPKRYLDSVEDECTRSFRRKREKTYSRGARSHRYRSEIG